MENLNFEFPKELPWSHIRTKGVYSLKEQTVQEFDNGETKTVSYYAFYEKDIGFGFKHALEILTVFNRQQTPAKTLILVKSLASTCKMRRDIPDRYLICREDYYYTIEDAIGALKGETRVYPPKRKPEVIRDLTEQQIKQYWEIPIIYDNEGKTFDRYTVIIGDAVYSMSKNAKSPQGVNQFGCKLQNPNTLRGLNLKALGEPINLEDLPNEVQEAIQERLKADYS